MKPNTWKLVAIMLGIVALLVSVNAIYHKSWFLGVFGVIVCVVLIILGIRVNAEKPKVPLNEVIESYKKFMEEYFQVSLPSQVSVYHNEETTENYVLVLSFDNNDSETLYFPFEADKFTGEFGRGMGQWMKDVREVEFWINKYAKTHKTADEIAKSMSNQVAKRIREELEFYNKSEREGYPDDREQRTGGGY